jgi:hypothetical protein
MVVRYPHVMEHPFQLLSKLEPALDLEFGEHATFGIVGDRPALKQSLGQMRLVVPFEDVALVDEPEHRDGLVEHSVNLLI